MPENKKPKLIYLGCGHERLKDFIHVEIDLGKNKSGPPDIIADISEYIPLQNNYADLVYSKATLEHLTYNELLNCLLESRRILKRGGIVRMVVPNFDKAIDDYLNKRYKPELKNIIFPNEKISNEDYVETFIGRMLYFDHRYLHNFYTLKKALEKTGFSEIRECKPGDSKIEEANGELYNTELKREGEVVVEAIKLDHEPSVKMTEKKYPKNPLAYLLARFLNIKISAYTKGRAKFPQKYWFKELFDYNKNKYKNY
ncbi:MAG: methyltransferase domain-containing protein [Patescibacteria group bacterium]